MKLNTSQIYSESENNFFFMKIKEYLFTYKIANLKKNLIFFEYAIASII